MADINIDRKRCKGCCLCVSSCPIGNIKMSDEANMQGNFFAEVVDTDECTGCALCCQMCPDMAIEIKDDKAKTSRPIVEYKTDKGSAKKVTVKGKSPV